MADTLICRICHRELPIEEFSASHRIFKRPRNAGQRKCRECVMRRNKENYSRYRALHLEQGKRYRQALRDEVFAAYGGYKCACCGETRKLFLSIDHVNGDGNKHRRAIGIKAGTAFYAWLRNNLFPVGFQVLCYNCNLGKRHNNNICPHVLEQLTP